MIDTFLWLFKMYFRLGIELVTLVVFLMDTFYDHPMIKWWRSIRST